MSHPFDMVVVGASGDLARRKLLPSLYYLHRDGRLAEGRVLCVARHEWTQKHFLSKVKKGLKEYVKANDFNDAQWQAFAERIHYQCMSAGKVEEYAQLKEMLAEHPDRARVFYLATPPRFFGEISQAIHAAGLVTPQARIVLEKPIGSDLASAQKINESVGTFFEEDQIYRIDHYLGKETVQNLMAVRFGNALFEPMWNSDRIDHVQITVAETLGVEGRGGYYDRAGALRDMVQNHILQLLCLVAMEPPTHLDQVSIREEKLKVLRALRPIKGSGVRSKTVRGQYRSGAIEGSGVNGYLEESDVPEDSMTETFVAIKAEVENWRWAGVPFYLRTGKRMGHKVSEIVIQFKAVPHHLFDDQDGSFHDNRLVIRLQPDESIKLGMMIKSPGSSMNLKPVALNLNMKDSGDRTPDAYERLLQDVIRGNATLFMHRDEVEEAWRWIEPIHAGWQKYRERPRAYIAGTWGPPESIALVVKDHRSWYEHLVA